MAELNGLIWWVIVLLAIVASVRGWKWRPWVFVAVTLVFRLGIESAIDQAASRVIGYTLSLDSEVGAAHSTPLLQCFPLKSTSIIPSSWSHSSVSSRSWWSWRSTPAQAGLKPDRR